MMPAYASFKQVFDPPPALPAWQTGPVSIDNAQQIAYWNGGGGASWAAAGARMDRELERLGALAMDALAPAVGSSVLDVGCGAGTTTLELAGRVGPSGRVVGLDVSATLLAVARRRAVSRGRGNVRFVRADAQDVALRVSFDAVFSRFGVMFFADPVAAFASLRVVASPGGRLGFVCWQSRADNPWFSAASMALDGMAEVELPPPADPAGPGPFAFADPGRVEAILRGAGWRDAGVRPETDELVLDEAALAQRIAFAVEQGPGAAALAAAGGSVRAQAALRAQAAQRVRAALLAFQRDGAVRFRRAVWVVTARA
jgi:SAM-dependent methyltransferase